MSTLDAPTPLPPTDTSARSQSAHEAEKLDVRLELRAIRELIQSGDLNSICRAAERLANVADNYYKPSLNGTIQLISFANRLRQEQKRLTFDQFNANWNSIVEDLLSTITRFETEPLHSLIAQDAVDSQPSLQQQELHSVSSLRRAEQKPAFGLDPVIENELIAFIGKTANPNHDRRLISCADLIKVYPKTKFALKPVSFELNRGEILGIVGVNASGKSTLLKMLVGDVRPNSGHLTFPYFNLSFY